MIQFHAQTTVPDLSDVTTRLRRAIQRALQRAAVLLQTEVQYNIATPYGPKPPALATGTLYHAVDHQVAHLHAVVFFHPPADAYAPHVEYGTSPHLPPHLPLAIWVRHRLGLEGQAAERAAYAIARAIAKRGTPGHFMLQRAVQKALPEIDHIFRQEIAQL